MGIKPSIGVIGKVRRKAYLTQDKESREFLDSPVPKGTIRFHSQLLDLLKTPFGFIHLIGREVGKWGSGGGCSLIFI